MDWGGYRTELHIGLSYAVSEATVCRTIKKVEDVPIKSKQFHLPGKKAQQLSKTVIDIALVNATEQPLERPKKTTQALQWQKEASYPKSTLAC